MRAAVQNQRGGDVESSIVSFQATTIMLSPTHTRTEGHAPVWGSKLITKAATQQGRTRTRANTN